MATISYTGTVQWQPDPEPFGDVISEQQVGPGHDPLIRYPGQWPMDKVLDRAPNCGAAGRPKPDRVVPA